MKKLSTPIFKKVDKNGNTLEYILNKVQEYRLNKNLSTAIYNYDDSIDIEVLVGRLMLHSNSLGRKTIDTILNVYGHEGQRYNALLDYGYESGIVECPYNN